MKKIKEQKKEKKKWSRKKKLILYPIISFFVIIALLSACTAAGFMAVEHDVKDANRKSRYIQIFTEIMEKKAGTDLTKPKASDFDEFREMEDERAEQSGYIVKMEGNVYDKAGNYYEARTEFWTPKNLKRYQVDLAKCQKKGKSEKEKQKEAEEKAKAKAEAEKKAAEKKKKEEEAKAKAEAKKKEKAKAKKESEEATESDTESSTEEESSDWNSAAEKVTDQDRIATYETAFQTALDDKKANLKYPWDYSDYDMIEKKYTYKGKDGYMVSVTCSKITTSADSDYHTGYMVMWISKDSMDDLSDCVVTLLQFDGESLV